MAAQYGVSQKKDGSLRVCLDFRPLNKITIPDRYPLPRIEDLLERVAGKRFYTSFDLASGYMQLLLSPESQAKCGWATHRGVNQFVYLPFSSRNAGAYFCRAMSRTLAGLDDNCLAYLDDIIVFDNDFDTHLCSLRKVLDRFRTFNIKVSGKKLTSIAQSKITFLGHEISGSLYSPAERNLSAIRNLPAPTSVQSKASWVWSTSFVNSRRTLLAAPFYALCKDKTSFKWDTPQATAFARLKEVLTSRPCSAFPQDKKFILHTDGSKVAVGAALLQQQDPDLLPKVIGYFSKTLSPSQQKWSPTYIELFAMISALRFFRATIYGNHTRVLCDHQPLPFLLRHRKPQDHMARWVVKLQSFDITIEYQKGSSNVLADHLSRNSDPTNHFTDGTSESEDIVEFPRCLLQRIEQPHAPRSATEPPLTPPLFVRPYDALLAQKEDPLCSAIMHFLETGSFPDRTPPEIQDTARDLADRCLLKNNGCLYFVDPLRSPSSAAIFVPTKLREPICVALYDSPTAGGHFGWKKTLAKITRRFFWPTLKEDVYRFVCSCKACQRKRPHPTAREILIPIHAGAIFDKVYLDLSGPYHPTPRHNKYIICLIDHFSRFVIAAPLPDCTAVTVAHAIMNHCILVFGAMTTLITDNASYFKGDLLTELGRLLLIGRYFTTPYHHEGNGVCERVFATFQEMLRTYIRANQSDKDLFYQRAYSPTILLSMAAPASLPSS
uniref:RNA-directed DNA polymerase n=1 Tax=Haemonchus placei TaxID=6290 RepID=A0A0N4WGV8_HAEPC